MQAAVQRIRRLGFRKWYERELLRSHAHLVLLLLAMIALLGSFEAFTLRQGLLEQLWLVACALASTVIGLWALRRYLYLLKHAEYVADQAICHGCQTYARWDAVADDDGRGEPGLKVCCRSCGGRWRISL